MPRRRKNDVVTCKHFQWIIYPRSNGGVYYADGRSNRIDLGRHSLGTKDRESALQALHRLDAVKAVEHGLADSSILDDEDAPLSIQRGVDLYLEHAQRPPVLGGVSPRTLKRYRAVFDKFEKFAGEHPVRDWRRVNAQTLHRYGRWLFNKGLAQKTTGFELTVLKQVHNHLLDAKHLPQACRFKLPVRKVQGTSTYCFTDEQVQAILNHCFSLPKLTWLGEIFTGLAYTGLRIGELAQLRWSAVDLEAQVLRVIDNTAHARRPDQVELRTKNHGSRNLPIHQDLLLVLRGLSRRNDRRVFHGPNGGVVKPDKVLTALRRRVLDPLKERFPSEPGEPGFVDGKVHSFRHFFCSRCAREGVPEQVVMHWLGHRDSDVVKLYFHLHDKDARQQMERLQTLRPTTAEQD